MWRNNTPFTTIGIQLSGSFTGRVFQQLPTDVHSHLGLNGDVAVYDNFSLMLPPSKTIWMIADNRSFRYISLMLSKGSLKGLPLAITCWNLLYSPTLWQRPAVSSTNKGLTERGWSCMLTPPSLKNLSNFLLVITARCHTTFLPWRVKDNEMLFPTTAQKDAHF